jgi:hypothetical protein
MSPDEREYFCDLVDMHHARNQMQREEAKRRIERYKAVQDRYNQLEKKLGFFTQASVDNL